MFVGLPSAAVAQPATSATPAATKSVGAPAAKPKITATPLSAKAAKPAVADVNVPHPTLRPVPVRRTDITPRAAAPAQVSGLSATADPLMANVTLSWTAPAPAAGDSPVTGYQLTRSGSSDYAQVPASTTRYTWTGLTFGTSYTFTVAPLSADGAGDASSTHAVTATGIVVPRAPRVLTAAWKPVQQTALVTWAAPLGAGSGSVQNYALYLDGTLYNHYAPSTTGLQLAGLLPGVTYTFGVAAISGAGEGPVTTATVAVPARAGSDDFAQRTTIGGVSGTVSGDNTESSDEPWEPTPTAKRAGAGKASVWYSWTAPASGPVTMTTSSSSTDRDTTLDVFTGSSVGTLSKIAGNDDPSADGRLAVVTFGAEAGATYAIGVSGYRTTATGVGPFSLSWSGSAIGAKSTTTTLTASVGSARSVTLTAAVTASFGTPVGHVFFYDGTTVVGDDFLNSASTSPTLTLTDLVRGDHDFTAKFVPSRSDLYAESTSPDKTVTIAASTTATTLRGRAEAQQVTLTATVAPSAAGTVQFHEGSTLAGTGTVAYGKSTIVLTGATPGNHSYVATFVPADLERYAGSPSSARSVTVAAHPPAKETTTSLSGQVSGRTANLVVTVAATGLTPAGTVQVADGDTVVETATLSAGSATLTVGDLTRGTHSFTATFVPAGPAVFAASTSATTSLVVAATPTATALTTSLSGRTVTLQTTVSPAAAGTVRLSDGGALVSTITLSGGAGRIEVPDVAVGTHHYTATYVPADDLRHATSTSPTQDVTVDPAVTTTALGSSVSAHEVTLTATVTSAAAAGTVTFSEGGEVVGTETVSAGVATTILTAVATGTHTYTATFTPTSPAEQAGSVSPNHTATVVATPTTTELSASVVDQAVTLTGTVTTAAGSVTGKVEFHEGSTLVGTVPLTNGSADLQLSDVAPGAHSYVAKFVPSDTTHAPSSSATRTATVKGSTATTLQGSVAGTAVTLTAAVTGPGTPAGTVEFREGSNLLGTKPLSGGAASLTVSPVAAGDHSYVATFVPTVPSEYATSASAPQTVDVARVATATTLTVTVTGRSVDLSSTVSAGSGTPAGSVLFRDGAAIVGTTTLSGGVASVTLEDLTPGARSYTATFVPTGTTHNGSRSPTRPATILGTTSTTLSTVVTGRTVVATAVVTSDGAAPAGSVAFYRDGTRAGTEPLVDGAAVYTATDAVPGSYNYTATFEPALADSTASASAVSVATVGKVASTTTLVAEVDDRTVTLDAGVTVTDGAAAGKVQFRDGDTVVGAVIVATGAASLTLGDVTPGDHTYRATFVPSDPTVYGGSDSDAQTATAALVATTTALTASASGQTVTLRATPATASGRLTGSVELYDGSTLLEAVTLTETTVVLTRTDVTPGSHTYTAKFVPTGTTHAASTSPDRTVTAAERSSATDLSATVGVRTVTLDATVGSGSLKPPGDVVFHDGTTLVGSVALNAGGVAHLEVPSVAPGLHTYTATFVPSDATTYTGSVSPSRSLRVLPIVTTTNLTLTPGSGQEVELAAQVTGASDVPAGRVVFRESGTFLRKVALLAGSAVLDLDDIVPGAHTYTATFVPTDPVTYAGSASSSRSVTVDPIATETGLTAVAGASTVRLEADLDSDAAGRIVFREAGTAVGQVTLAGRAAVLTLADVEPGPHTFTATFEPTNPATYAGSVSPDRDVTVRFPTSTDLTASATGRAVLLVATVTGAGSPAGDIVFTGGDDVVPPVPVTAGAATVTLSDVTPGNHDYQATFVPASAGTVAGSVSAVRSMTVTALTTTALTAAVDGAEVTLDAKVTSSGGSPAGTVEFREGGDVVGETRLHTGAASTTVTGVPPGDHVYRAFFTPDDPVAFDFSSTAPRFARVAPAATDTDLTVTADRRTVSFTTEVTSPYMTPAGAVTIREGAEIIGTADLVGGVSHFEVAGVDPGQHVYTATYLPTRPATHVGSTSPGQSVTVTGTGLTVSASLREVTLEAAVTMGSSTPVGDVTFREGAKVVGAATVHGGVAATKLTGVTPGAHAYTATFVPLHSVAVAGSVSPVGTVTVAPISTTTTLDAVVTARIVTLSAAVTLIVAGQSETVEGDVVFRDGATEVGRTGVSGGAASATLTNVAPGGHAYTATFVPADPVTLSGSVSLSPAGEVTVAPISTTTTLRTPEVAVRVVTLSADVAFTVAGQSETVEGDVVFRDGKDVVGTRPVRFGTASTVLSGVEPGPHTYTATFVPSDPVTLSGSASLPPGEVTVVAPIDSTTELKVTPSGRTVTLSAVVASASDTPKGNVVFSEGNKDVGTTAVEGRAASKVIVTDVAPGEHTYTATFVPADRVDFAGSKSRDETVTVDPIATTTTLLAKVSGRAVTLTAGLTTAEGTLAGAVAFSDGPEPLETVPLDGGTAVLRLADADSGVRAYTATFVPADKSHDTSASTRHVAVPYASATKVTATVTGSRVDLSSEVTSDAGSPKGEVAFYDGDRILGGSSGVDGDGRARQTINGVFGGTHTYRAVFLPACYQALPTCDKLLPTCDKLLPTCHNVLPSDGTVSVVVAPTATTTGLVVERKPNSRRVVLTATTSASFGSPAGTVTFSDTTGNSSTDVDVPVSGGKARTILSSVATGTHAYLATFVPTNKATYAGSASTPAGFTMTASPTTTEISVRNLRGTVTVEAKVTSPDGVPTGKVLLTQDGEAVSTPGPLDAGAATVQLANVAEGAHTYVATYVPDDDSYLSSVSQGVTGKVAATIQASATTTSLSVDTDGRTVTLSAGVTSLGGPPDGSVVFMDGGTRLAPVAVAAGAASLTLRGVAAGPHTYGAVFVPTDLAAFGGSSLPARRVTVYATATTTSLTGAVSGTTATLRVTVAGAADLAPLGNVRVVDGSKPVGQVQLIDGSATLVVTRADAGEHSYRATFEPSTADFAGSTSPSVALTVRPLASKTTLTAPTRAKAGTSPTVQVTVLRGSATAGGKVLLTYGSRKITLALRGGRASVKLPKVRKGTLTVTATHLGDATTAKSTATSRIKVIR